MNISDCCALLGFSKQAYYKQRIHHEKKSLENDVLLREVLIIRQSLPVLGGRKLYALLGQRLPSALLPGRDKFFECLRFQGLLIRKRREYRPITTVSWHHFHKYPNLWKGRIPDGPNQVWASDITYIRTRTDEIIRIYNQLRPHMSNDYLTPEQAHLQNGTLRRRWKTYYKKKEELCEQIS